MAETHDPDAETRAALFQQPEEHWPAVSRDVAEGDAPVATVYRDPNGSWWFMSDSDAELVPHCLPCLLTLYPELSEVADLALDSVAHRRDATWERGPRPDEWGPWE